MDSFEELCGRLRSWPRGFVADLRVVVWQTLAACSELYRASGAVLAWEDREEPWLLVATLGDSGMDWREEDSADFAPLVDPALSDTPFLLRDAQVQSMFGKQVSSAPIHPRMRERLDADSVITIPIRGETMEGFIFVLNPASSDGSMLVLSELVARFVEDRMDSVAQYRTGQRDGVAEERLRVARDLHDGLLQSFTGVVLQLETIHDILDSEPDRARRMLTEAQGIIMSDQRELRAFVEELRPRRRRVESVFDFSARLDDLRARFRQQWGIEVAIDAAGVDATISSHLGQETFRLIHESVMNSAKHSGATRVDVRLRTADSRIRIEVTDNGGGFPFHGRLTLESIREKGIGPAALAERVASLNGDLAIESTDQGARLEISVPLGWSGA
jgi:signal transduction histidine kinase